MEEASLKDLLLNPGIFLLLSSILLYISKYIKDCRVFNILAIIIPIVAILILFLQPSNTYWYNFYGLWQVSFEYSFLNKVVCISILLCSVFINISVWHSYNYQNIIFSIIYMGSSIIAILSIDFLTSACSFELMTLTATIIIYNQVNELQIEAAYRYLIVHFFSGSLILAGGIILTELNGFQIVQLTNLLQDFKQSWLTLGGALILLGLLINIACPPFSSWLIDSYSVSNAVGSAYLSILTSKVSLIWILKLFLGLEILTVIGIFIAIFGVVYSILENNIKRSFCYLSISKFGVILIPMGFNNVNLPLIIIALCASHILYQSFIMLMYGWLHEKYQITYFTDFNNKIIAIDFMLVIGLSYSLASLFSIPFFSSYYVKLALGQYFYTESYNIYSLINIITASQILFIPWLQIFKNIKIIQNNRFVTILDDHKIVYINKMESVTVLSFIVINLVSHYFLLPSVLIKVTPPSLIQILQQTVIIIAGFVSFYIVNPQKTFNQLLLPESILYKNIYKLINLFDKYVYINLQKFNLENFINLVRLSKNNLLADHIVSTSLTILILSILIIVDISKMF